MDYETWIIRYGLSTTEYTAVEAACIDLLRAFPIAPVADAEERLLDGCKAQLVNLRREKSEEHGLMRLQDLVREKAAPVLEYYDPLLIITLGEWQDKGEPIPGGQWREGCGFRSEWLVSKANTSEDGVKSDATYREEIRKSTCAWWKLNNDRIEREGIEYVVSAYRGVTRALFRIIEGTCESVIWEYEENGQPKTQKRIGWQLEMVSSGPVFDQVVGEYGHRIHPKPGQNQHYWPF